MVAKTIPLLADLSERFEDTCGTNRDHEILLGFFSWIVLCMIARTILSLATLVELPLVSVGPTAAPSTFPKS